jgi:hypothetical protein
MCQELQIFAVVYMYSGAGCLVRLCDSEFGITPVGDITIGITCVAFCFHIEILLLLLLLLLSRRIRGCSVPHVALMSVNDLFRS